MEPESYWLDNDTFVYIPLKGKHYYAYAEYHADEDRYVFVKVYEYDQMLWDISDKRKQEIIRSMEALMMRHKCKHPDSKCTGITVLHGNAYCENRLFEQCDELLVYKT